MMSGVRGQKSEVTIHGNYQKLLKNEQIVIGIGLYLIPGYLLGNSDRPY